LRINFKNKWVSDVLPCNVGLKSPIGYEKLCKNPSF
jgi:hypothetical protein